MASGTTVATEITHDQKRVSKAVGTVWIVVAFLSLVTFVDALPPHSDVHPLTMFGSRTALFLTGGVIPVRGAFSFLILGIIALGFGLLAIKRPLNLRPIILSLVAVSVCSVLPWQLVDACGELRDTLSLRALNFLGIVSALWVLAVVWAFKAPALPWKRMLARFALFVAVILVLGQSHAVNPQHFAKGMPTGCASPASK